MIKSTLKISRYSPLVIQGFSNFLALFQGIMANPDPGIQFSSYLAILLGVFFSDQTARRLGIPPNGGVLSMGMPFKMPDKIRFRNYTVVICPNPSISILELAFRLSMSIQALFRLTKFPFHSKIASLEFRVMMGYVGVSKNNGTPKSSILIGFSSINHPFWGTPIFGNIHVDQSHHTGEYCFALIDYMDIFSKRTKTGADFPFFYSRLFFHSCGFKSPNPKKTVEVVVQPSTWLYFCKEPIFDHPTQYCPFFWVGGGVALRGYLGTLSVI